MNTLYKISLLITVVLASTPLASSQNWYDTAQSSFERFKDTVTNQLPSSYEEMQNILARRRPQVSSQELYDNIKKISNAASLDELSNALGELKQKGAILSSNAIDKLHKGLKDLQKTGTELSSSALKNIEKLIDDWLGTSKAWLKSLKEKPATMKDIENEFVLLKQEDDDFVLVEDDDGFELIQ